MDWSNAHLQFSIEYCSKIRILSLEDGFQKVSKECNEKWFIHYEYKSRQWKTNTYFIIYKFFLGQILFFLLCQHSSIIFEMVKSFSWNSANQMQIGRRQSDMVGSWIFFNFTKQECAEYCERVLCFQFMSFHSMHCWQSVDHYQCLESAWNLAVT